MCGTTPSSLKKKLSSGGLSSPLVKGNPLAPSSALDPTGSLRAIDTRMTEGFNRATGGNIPSMSNLVTTNEANVMNALGIGDSGGPVTISSGTVPAGFPEPTAGPPGLKAEAYTQDVADQAAAKAAADEEAKKLKAWRGEQNRQGRASTILGGRKVYMGGGVGTSARRTLLPA